METLDTIKLLHHPHFFLGGGVCTEQNSTIFWVAGYEQNSVTYGQTPSFIYIDTRITGHYALTMSLNSIPNSI